MPITPDDLLSLADTLLGEPTEVYHRAAASRAYYAAYHLCVPVGNSIRTDAKEPLRSHRRLLLRLQNFRSDDSDLQSRVRAVGFILEQTRDLRTLADYRLADAFTSALAEQSCKTARHIEGEVAELRQLLGL